GLTFGAPDAPYTPPPLRNFTDEELFEKQTEILKRIASRHDCVVIGWAGVYVLPRHPGMLSIFCHAPIRFRIKRIMELYHVETKAEALTILEESDETRKRYFDAMTGHDWACAENYHISIDTSLLPMEEIAEMLIALI